MFLDGKWPQNAVIFAPSIDPDFAERRITPPHGMFFRPGCCEFFEGEIARLERVW